MLLDGILHNALDLCSDLEKNGRKYLSLNNPMTCPTPDGCFIVHRAWRPSILLKADGWKLSVAPTTHNEVWKIVMLLYFVGKEVYIWR